ncbi:hypothetical protein AHF37_09963 [Paragonimus kellicotti]|nr:hypothetical protein AHF37_09963 [Paragonimus kellicotti]
MRDDMLAEPIIQFMNFFPSLTGTCSLAFFIHNALQTILRAQRHPENNNFLDNLYTDIPVFIGRLGLLFQMSTVYPMIVYILRGANNARNFQKRLPELASRAGSSYTHCGNRATVRYRLPFDWYHH